VELCTELCKTGKNLTVISLSSTRSADYETWINTGKLYGLHQKTALTLSQQIFNVTPVDG